MHILKQLIIILIKHVRISIFSSYISILLYSYKNHIVIQIAQKICTPQNSDREIIQKNDKAISDGNNICSMDWEEMDGNMQLISNVSSNVTKTDYKLIVVDTNILLKHLRSIQNATNDNIKSKLLEMINIFHK